ncbi:hypothetical protein QUF69_05845 [Peribacillus frigoritolerans]|nr:hypothetical protein [Peribacillus frigoritolerans]MDM5310337.1 hypothetical protein [Peribacillus frigoritolerans]
MQGLSLEERNIYFEVLNTTLAMFHEDYVYEETKVITDVNQLDFETTGKTGISKVWKEFFNIQLKMKKSRRRTPHKPFQG